MKRDNRESNRTPSTRGGTHGGLVEDLADFHLVSESVSFVLRTNWIEEGKEQSLDEEDEG